MAGPERLRGWVATGFGLGRIPLAPGSWGSLGGLALVVLAWRVGGGPVVLVATGVIVAAGFWAAQDARSRFGSDDPGPVVIDEIAGQMLALAWLTPSLATLVAGFLLFRLFDIWKPFPVARLERLPGASGIMTDDLAAGVYANLVQQALSRSLAGLWGSA